MVLVIIRNSSLCPVLPVIYAAFNPVMLVHCVDNTVKLLKHKMIAVEPATNELSAVIFTSRSEIILAAHRNEVKRFISYLEKVLYFEK